MRGWGWGLEIAGGLVARVVLARGEDVVRGRGGGVATVVGVLALRQIDLLHGRLILLGVLFQCALSFLKGFHRLQRWI